MEGYKYMSNLNKYYDVTQKDRPHKNIKYFIKNIKTEPMNAIDLGCGQGNDTVYLIKNGWKVLGIDKENVENRIRNRLNKCEQKLFEFELQNFEELRITNTRLIVANFSLPFCTGTKFEETWKEIEKSLLIDGYFVGTFLGKKDSWNKGEKTMTFLNLTDIQKIFKKFKIIKFRETEIDKETALGNQKHWHVFEIIAKKIV